MSTVYGFATVMEKLCLTRTIAPPYQEPVSRVGIPVRTTPPAGHLGWRQRFHLWRAARRCESLQRLDDLWDAHHEQVQVWPADIPRDFVIQQSRPALRAAIYHHLALS
jgi:hypothetical protein